MAKSEKAPLVHIGRGKVITMGRSIGVILPINLKHSGQLSVGQAVDYYQDALTGELIIRKASRKTT